MSRVFQVLSLISFLLLSPGLAAQLNSSSALLLKPTGKNPSKQNLDSSRYKIRAPESRRVIESDHSDDDEDELAEKPGTLIPSPSLNAKSRATTTTTVLDVPSEPPPPNVAVPAAVIEPAPTPTPAPAPPSPAAPASPPTAETRVPVTEQVRTLILGGSDEEIHEAKTQIHPQDPRGNVLEILIAPAFFYNDSNSGYSFRDYISNGPGIGLGMNLWLTPFFGLQSRFFSSASSSVRSGGTNMAPEDVQMFEAGVRFRKHFGYSRKAAHLNWGVDYHDAINKISKEATTVVGRKSSGLSVAMEAVIPASNTYAHTMQVDIRPRLRHSEMNTAAQVKSGTKAETNAISLSLGGQWSLDRKNQIFWKTQYSVERNLFKGEATLADPHNGMTPDGVSVTNSTLIFYFGFRWGS